MTRRHPLGHLILIAAAFTLLGWLGRHVLGQTYQPPPPPPPVVRGQQYQGLTIRDKVHVLGQMDLPVEPPTLGKEPFPVPEHGTPEPDEEDDDPRDTPPPVFYGEVLDRSGSMRRSAVLGDAHGVRSRLARRVGAW